MGFLPDAIKEQYYPIGSYEDQYTRLTTLHQEWDQTVPDFTNIFHTLCTKLGIKDFELIWCSNTATVCIDIL
jgi:hypothetical protein